MAITSLPPEEALFLMMKDDADAKDSAWYQFIWIDKEYEGDGADEATDKDASVLLNSIYLSMFQPHRNG